jgi:hypothetical protein
MIAVGSLLLLISLLHVLPIERPRLRSRLELAWNPAAPASPAARVLVENARAFLLRNQDRIGPSAPGRPQLSWRVCDHIC